MIIADSLMQKRNIIISLIIYAVAIGWMIGLCFSDYDSYTMYNNGVQYQCKLKYTAHIRCVTNNMLVSNNRISNQYCPEDGFQCNCILAAYPITLIVCITTFIVSILTIIKHATFPRNSASYNMLNTLIITVSSLMLLGVGSGLLYSLSGDDSYNLSGWVLASQIIISILLLVSIKFIKSEEQISQSLRQQQQESKEMEIRALTVL